MMQYKEHEIKIITCERGDWSIVEVDGEEYMSGHSFDIHDWVDLIRDLFNQPVEEIEVSNDEMERMS